MDKVLGMMPRKEIEIEERYLDINGYDIVIQAGVHGWSILYSGLSSEFKDIDDSSDNNFKEAYNIATSNLGILLKL